MDKTLNHLGIILDGNRRWAKERNLPLLEGHKKGAEKIKDVVLWCLKKNIKNLTLYVFSTENWNRAEKEIDYLMKLAQSAAKMDLDQLKDYGVRIKIIGDRQRIPDSILKLVDKVEETTKDNDKINLNLAFSYGGRDELVRAFRKIVNQGVKEIDEKLISDNLSAPDLDMVIRTGKEKRLSNFLIWQAAYAELYFSDKYWPDFSEQDFNQVLTEYSNRQRRFGK